MSSSCRRLSRRELRRSQIYEFKRSAAPLASSNSEGDAHYALRRSLSDPENVPQSWDPTLVNPCTWFNLTCKTPILGESPLSFIGFVWLVNKAPYALAKKSDEGMEVGARGKPQSADGACPTLFLQPGESYVRRKPNQPANCGLAVAATAS